MKLATGPMDKDADAFYQKRVPEGRRLPRDRHDHVPLGAHRRRDPPDGDRGARPARAHGALTFHPWPVRRADVDRPDELRIDLDPQPGTTFTDAVRVAGVARELFAELGITAYVSRRATAGCTCTRGSSRAGSSSTCGTRPSASAGSWRRVTTG